jgi:hypothetical protein
VAGGGIETLAGTIVGTLRMKADAVIYRKKVKRVRRLPTCRRWCGRGYSIGPERSKHDLDNTGPNQEGLGHIEEYPYELGKSPHWCSCIVVEYGVGCHVDVGC